MIKINNIYKKYGNNEVLKGIDYIFKKNEITTIMAPNGTGKTTLLSIISGLLLPDNGKVEYFEKEGKKNISIVLSGEKNLYMKNTVKENLYYFGIIRGMSKKEIYDQITENVKYLPMISDIQNELVERLSYGQKRLVAIFSAMISNAGCILLDEVSEGLDMKYTNLLQKLITTLSHDRSIIMASHDYDFVSSISDKLVFLKNGKIAKECEKMSLIELKKYYIKLYNLEGEV